MGKITEEQRIIIVDRMENGYSQTSISRELKLAQCSVRKVWLRYLETGSTKNKPKSGRLPKTTVREKRRLCQKSKQNPFLTPKEILHELNLFPSISLCTVRRILKKSGLYAKSAAKKPLLNKVHIKKRISFCRGYLAFPMSCWKNVIFTDECQIKMFSTRRVIVRRPVSARFVNRYVTKTVKFGGASVLVWGAIKADGSKILIKCPDRLNSINYQSVLNEGLFQLYDPENILMQDGAPCHKSKSTSDFLESKNVCVINDWPAQSPDLNIIENMWSILKYRVSKYFTRSKEELWDTVCREWYSIDNDIVKKLYESIPKRLTEIYSSKGQHCKY